MRGQRPVGRGQRDLGAKAVAKIAVEARRRRAGVSVARDAVRAQRVDDEEQDGLRSRAAAAGEIVGSVGRRASAARRARRRDRRSRAVRATSPRAAPPPTGTSPSRRRERHLDRGAGRLLLSLARQHADLDPPRRVAGERRRASALDAPLRAGRQVPDDRRHRTSARFRAASRRPLRATRRGDRQVDRRCERSRHARAPNAPTRMPALACRQPETVGEPRSARRRRLYSRPLRRAGLAVGERNDEPDRGQAGREGRDLVVHEAARETRPLDVGPVRRERELVGNGFFGKTTQSDPDGVEPLFEVAEESRQRPVRRDLRHQPGLRAVGHARTHSTSGPKISRIALRNSAESPRTKAFPSAGRENFAQGGCTGSFYESARLALPWPRPPLLRSDEPRPERPEAQVAQVRLRADEPLQPALRDVPDGRSDAAVRGRAVGPRANGGRPDARPQAADALPARDGRAADVQASPRGDRPLPRRVRLDQRDAPLREALAGAARDLALADPALHRHAEARRLPDRPEGRPVRGRRREHQAIPRALQGKEDRRRDPAHDDDAHARRVGPRLRGLLRARPLPAGPRSSRRPARASTRRRSPSSTRPTTAAFRGRRTSGS